MRILIAFMAHSLLISCVLAEVPFPPKFFSMSTLNSNEVEKVEIAFVNSWLELAEARFEEVSDFLDKNPNGAEAQVRDEQNRLVKNFESIYEEVLLLTEAFEQWIGMELRAALSYQRAHLPLSFWRTTHGDEVDYLIGEEFAVECKASQRVTDRDAKGLYRLKEERKFKKFFLVSLDPVERKSEGVHYIPYRKFIEMLWSEKL